MSQVTGSSEELTASADQSAEVTQTIVDVSGLSTHPVDSVNTAAQTIERISAGVKEMTATIHLSSVQTKSAVKVAAFSNESINRAISQLSDIEHTVSATRPAWLSNSASARRTSDTLSIFGIAGQPNLLALTAAIEAARAGGGARALPPWPKKSEN